MQPLLIALLWLLTTVPLQAQGLQGFIRTQAAPFKPVAMATEAGALTEASALTNAIFKPPGPGPFPAVVLVHSCGGVNRPHIRERARELLSAGFVVLTLDSFGPRGVANSCNGDPRGIGVGASLVDAYAALERLGELSMVDRNRIYASGYSRGAVVTPMLATPQSAGLASTPLRFRAVVSNYGGCSFQRGPGAARLQFLQRDVDRPVLILMASEDREYKPADCFPLLDDMKAAGRPVEWHVYPDTHHAWDHRDHNGSVRVTTGWGETSVYLYNAEATRDSTRRMIEFFTAHR